MKVIVKEPNKLPEVIECSNTLKAMQKLVGGYVELQYIGANTVLLCNEDGMALNLKENCGYLGTIVVLGSKIIDGEAEWCSLTNEQITKAIKWFTKHDNHAHPGMAGVNVIFGDEEVRKAQEQIALANRNMYAEWDAL